MAGASGVTIGGAVSDKDPGHYNLVRTEATSGDGSGLVVNFIVNADGTISSTNFNIISRGFGYEVGDTFELIDHGENTQMSVATTSLTLEFTKHNRYYVQVQPNNLAGPPTLNLSDRDVIGTGGGGGGGDGITGGAGMLYRFKGTPPIDVDTTKVSDEEEHIDFNLDFIQLDHR